MKLFNIKNLFSVPSLLNVAGIAVAVAAFYVIMSVVDFDMTFNHGVKDCEKVYALSFGWQEGKRDNIICRPLGEGCGREIPSVESYGCLNPWVDWSLYLNRNDSYHQLDIRTGAISKGLLSTFGFEIVAGDTSQFDDMNKVIISRANAEKFGIQVGDVLKYDLNSRDEIEVVAVYDLDPNTELRPFGGFRCIGKQYLDVPNWSVTTYYYKSSTPITNEMLAMYMPDIVRKALGYSFGEPSEEDRKLYTDEELKAKQDSALMEYLKPQMISLNNLHFSPEINGFHEPANPKVVYTLLVLAFVIIAIAYINYINFFFARVPKRIKSINTMKIFGSSRSHLVLMLMGESLAFTLVSMVLAFVLAYILAPWLIGSIVDMDIVFSNHKILLISVLIPLVTSLAVSLYPALHITNQSPALALRGNVTQSHDSVLRYVMIGFQIAASIALIIVSLFIHKNTDYVVNSDLGFNSHNLLGVETSQRISQSRDEVRQLLLKNPDIVDVTWAHSELIARMRHNASYYSPELPEHNIIADVVFVSDNFFKFMDIDIVEGRDFLPSDHLGEAGVYILNENARDKYRLTMENHIIEVKNNEYVNCEIVGFCKDIKFKPLHYEVSPLIFYIPGKSTPDYATLKQLYIRISEDADVSRTMKFIEKSLAEIDPDFAYMNHPVRTFQNEVMASNYTEESNLTHLITLFAFIAILISVMGIFGIVYFDTERRRKEIGVRRVNGATIWEILALFNRKFLILTAVCSVVAIPVAYVAVQKYFSGFAYHYGIHTWVFVVSVLMSAMATAFVVSAASFRAATENPVNTLKNNE
ncbi:MAG: FtsX-like permease family protein [Bacteroidales bacterium]|nr:FtsX-like permease family protein [Bacteroidales bacterium]